MKLFNKAGEKEVPNQAPASPVSNNTVQQPAVAATTPIAQPAPSQVQTNVTTTSQPSQSVNAGSNPTNTVMPQDKIMPLVKEEQSKAMPSSANKMPTPKANTNTASSEKIEELKETKNEGKNKNSRLKGYSYVVINSVNKKEKGFFDAESEDEVRAFLEGQDYQVLEVKPKSAMDIDISGPPKLKPEDLSFTLTQLSTYIKSGIPLVDSVRILAKQAKKPAHKKIYGQVVYELLKGESFSIALAKQGKVFPPLLINMVKTAEMTGDLPSILDDMAEYYTSMNQTRKQMKSAMTYPIVVLIIALGVLVFMLVYLVPQFASMFEQNDAKLPTITLAVLGISNFIQNYYIYLIVGIVAMIVIFKYLMKHVQSFKLSVQTILMKLPVVGKIIIYNEIANFTKTFASLLNHGVFITDSMEILSKITDNEVFKKIINKTLENLSKGEPVSSAFRGEWAIPVVAYEMIVTGENTGQLGLMMEKVSNHFQAMHKSIIDQMKSLMEPLMIVFLAGIVGVILLSIVTPMFSIYSQIE
jgi:type IV pilus assembly protein PilC